jgi:hypothetical protein
MRSKASHRRRGLRHRAVRRQRWRSGQSAEFHFKRDQAKPNSKAQNLEKPRRSLPIRITVAHADYSRSTLHQDIPPNMHARHVGRMSAGLLEQFFGCDGEAISDLGRAIEDFQNVIAERTVKFAGGSLPRGQFDPAETGVAFGADDIAFLHARTMPAVDKRSKTMSTDLNGS